MPSDAFFLERVSERCVVGRGSFNHVEESFKIDGHLWPFLFGYGK